MKIFCVTGSNNCEKRQISKNSLRFTKIERQLYQSPTTHAEHGRIVKSNFGGDNKRPNEKTNDVKDRP